MSADVQRPSSLRVFQNEKAFWSLTTVVVGSVALFKGLRYPNSWAATQAQVDYSFGFVKRGLFGAMIGTPLQLWHYQRFAGVSLLLLAALLCLLSALARKSGLCSQPDGRVAVAVFAASYVVTYLASLDGYLDIPLALLTVGLLMTRSLRLRLVLALPVFAIALLTHEMFLFVFLPVIVLSCVLQARLDEGRADTKLAYGGTAAIVIGAVAMTFVIAWRAPMDVAKVRAMSQLIQSRIDFTPQQEFFDVLSRSAGANIQVMVSKFGTLTWWATQVMAAVIFAPTILVLFFVMRQMLREKQKHSRINFAYCLVAALAPLSMNFFGWDLPRWQALTGLTTFLVLCVVSMHSGEVDLPSTPGLSRMAFLVIALSMASGGLLMGSYAKWYPLFWNNSFFPQKTLVVTT